MKKIMSFEEIDLLAKNLSNFVNKGDVIALIGNLGTGKTTFTQKFAKSLGVTENLKSPTFNYVLEYFSGRLPLYHFDVYRLSEAEEIYEVGYEDYLNNEGVLLIEWADIIKSELPKEYIEIRLDYNDESSREIEIKYIGNEKKKRRCYLMLILGIDTSTNIGSVALYSTETGLVGEMTINIKKTHSENIMVQLDNLLKITGTQMKDVDKISVSTGPGSFTGIRIGVAAAKGLASSGDFKMAGINELDAIASMSTDNDVEICSLIDARKERAYHCLYKYNNGSLERLEEYAVGELREYLETRKDKKTLYLGDGAIKYKDLICEVVNENAKFAKNSLTLPRASIVAELAINKEDNLYTMEPFYLSKTQAERQKEEQERKNK